MKRVKLSFFFLLLISFFACERRYNLYSEDLVTAKSRSPLMGTNKADDSSFYEGEYPDAPARKILYTAILSLRVDQPDTANIALEKLAARFEGYVQEIGTNRTIIRVQSSALDAAIEEIGAIGKVVYKEVTGSDVTLTYEDTKIRLENAKRARNRYLELLQKAETVDEILKVEKELERLNTELDILQGRINRIDHLEAFSTITINLKVRKKPGVLGYIGLGLYHSVKWLFVRN